MSEILSLFNKFILIVLLIFAFLLMINVSQQDAATMDELAHIPAGYSYVKFLDFRLNPEHPPLLKVLSGFPLIFLDLNFPTDSDQWNKEVNAQWDIGTKFLYQSGNDADQILFWARIGPIILTLLTALIIYIWSKELLGPQWTLLPVFLFLLSPTVLAHGHYVTTDIAAAFGTVFAFYFFIKFLLKPSKKHLIFAGLALGLAQLAKFSSFLLLPFFFVLISIFYIISVINDWSQTEPLKKFFHFGMRLFRYYRSLMFIFLIGFLLVYFVYAVFIWNYPLGKQISDTQSILSSFPNKTVTDFVVSMAGSRIFRPLAHYLLGLLMVTQRSAGGNTAYFLGQVSNQGWWYYFPLIFSFKESLPSLFLIAGAGIFGLWHAVSRLKTKTFNAPKYLIKRTERHFLDYLGTSFPEFSMLTFIVFYFFISMQSPLNIGVRHLAPVMPFLYILSASGIKRWINNAKKGGGPAPWWKKILNFFKTSFKSLILCLLLLWLPIETIRSYPYFLSYFNQFRGGTKKGYEYATDSNYDWGQDLKRLKDFVEKRKIDKIAVDYFGGGNPEYYLGNKFESWHSNQGNPADIGIRWLAISTTFLQQSVAKVLPSIQRKPEEEYRWLREIKDIHQPDYRAGTSIFIYKL